MNKQEPLNALVGKEVQEIEHIEMIGNIKIHFTDGCCVQFFAQDKASQHVVIIEPEIQEVNID